MQESRRRILLLGVLAPLALIAAVQLANTLQGRSTLYVGAFAAVPMFAAVFGTPLTTGLVAIISWLTVFASSSWLGDLSIRASWGRLVAIAVFGIIAVLAANSRVKREGKLAEAEHAAIQAEQFREMAETDLLTDIPNRRGVLRAISERDPGMPRTLALLDIDNLKSVNDSLGHLVGDEYISAVGRRLVGSIASTDIVGRWGGDEFLIILELPFDHSEPVLGRAHAAIVSRPVTTSGKVVDVSVSLGVTSWSVGQSLDDALSKADVALYEAKQSGRNQLTFVP